MRGLKKKLIATIASVAVLAYKICAIVLASLLAIGIFLFE